MRAFLIIFGKIFCIILVFTLFVGITMQEGRDPSFQQGILEELEILKNIPYRFEIDSETVKTLSAKDLEIRYDEIRTIQKLRDLNNPLVIFFSKKQQGAFRPVVILDTEKLEKKLRNLFSSFEFPSVDAELIREKESWMVKPSVRGRVLKAGELERIQKEIQQSLFQKTTAHRIAVDFNPLEVNQHEDSFRDFLQVVKEIAEEPIEIIFDLKKEILLLQDYKEALDMDLEKKTVGINASFLSLWIDEFAKRNEISSGKVLIKGKKEVISEYDKKSFQRALFEGNFAHGKVINKDSFREQLLRVSFKKGNERKVLVERETKAPIIDSEVGELKFPDLLSTGVTSFKLGNYPARVKNITLSLASLHGAIILPQEEFSFNRLTGWIHQGKGYTKTKIIVDGRIEEGVGGGVCQTSTTLFRAILNAGLPIKERKPHSLDVAYYHQYGYGLDASVFTEGGQDLRFVNDFPNPILISTSIDDQKNEATVEFYGISDQRKVEITNIFTGNALYKRWSWRIIFPEKEELRFIESRYILPRQERLKPLNPLEG